MFAHPHDDAEGGGGDDDDRNPTPHHHHHHHQATTDRFDESHLLALDLMAIVAAGERSAHNEPRITLPRRVQNRHPDVEVGADADLEALEAPRWQRICEHARAARQYLAMVEPIYTARAQRDWLFALLFSYERCDMKQDVWSMTRSVLAKYLIGDMDPAKRKIYPPKRLDTHPDTTTPLATPISVTTVTGQAASSSRSHPPTPLETIRAGGQRGTAMQHECGDSGAFYFIFAALMRFVMFKRDSVPLPSLLVNTFRDPHGNSHWVHLFDTARQMRRQHDPLEDTEERQIVRETLQLALFELPTTLYARFFALVMLSHEPKLRNHVSRMCPQEHSERFWPFLLETMSTLSRQTFTVEHADQQLYQYFHRLMCFYEMGFDLLLNTTFS